MLQVTGVRVLVKRIDAPKAQSSLIVIPETADGEKSSYAVVLNVGPRVSEDIKISDTVVLMPYCGSPVQVVLDGALMDAQIVSQDDILATVRE